MDGYKFEDTMLSSNQLEKLEAARSAYLWFTLVTFPGLTEPH